MRITSMALWAVATVGCGRTTPVADLDDVEVVIPPECSSNVDCPDGQRCWVDPVAAQNRCVDGCDSDADCADGLECRVMFDTRACVDPLPEPPPPIEVVDQDGFPVAPGNVDCIGPVNDAVEIQFAITPDTQSISVVPFSTDGGAVRPLSWQLPSGDFAFTNGGAGFLGVTSALLGYTAPLFLPQAPLLDELMQPGTHVYTVLADTEQLCVYSVEEQPDTGTSIDLNLYFVGLNDLNAASAASDPDLAVALDTFADIVAEAGIDVDQIRVIDAPPDVADEFSVITDRNQLDALAASSVPPGDSDDELLSVNIFLVSVIDFDGSNAIGISQGIAGPAGLHGTPGSGVVFTSEFLRLGVQEDPTLGAQLTGAVMAHEVGHWLGLFHTTEQNGQQDPLPDTPVCEDIVERAANNQLDGCPDRTNFMFPIASAFARTVTPDQADVLVANPVTR